MSSPSTSSNRVWPAVAPYVAPPLAASFAIVPVYRDMVAKSAQQRGQPVPSMTFSQYLKGGLKLSPTVGGLVGGQMVMQAWVEKALAGKADTASLFSACASSALVGMASSPVVAVFNGQTMRWGVFESLRRFTPRQGVVISLQESAFVAGLRLVDPLAAAMRKWFGRNKAVDYTSAFFAGAVGSLVGHPANTALTRWQSGMTVDSLRQLMWGSLRKARAVGCFSVVFKVGKETLHPTALTK